MKEIMSKLNLASIVAREVQNRINVYCTPDQLQTARAILKDYKVRTTEMKYSEGIIKIEVKEK